MGNRVSGQLAFAVARSQNAKTGDAVVTYAAQQSCPSSCVFKDGGGCYAESGILAIKATRPLNADADRVHATQLDVAIDEAAAIDELPFPFCAGRPMRLHTVGDCATDEAARVVAAAAGRYMDRGGGQVWTYTHAWRTVKRASWGRVAALASCESPDDVRAAHRLSYAASMVVEELPGRRRYQEGGVQVIPCPAQTGHETCSTCRLCMDDARLLDTGFVIGFGVHGTGLSVKKAKHALADPDDPARKLTSRDHALDYRRRHARWPRPVELERLAGVSSGSAWEMLNRLRSGRTNS